MQKRVFSKASAQHSVLSFDREFPKAPGNHDYDNRKEQEIRAHEQKYENVIGKRASKPPVFEL